MVVSDLIFMLLKSQPRIYKSKFSMLLIYQRREEEEEEEEEKKRKKRRRRRERRRRKEEEGEDYSISLKSKASEH